MRIIREGECRRWVLTNLQAGMVHATRARALLITVRVDGHVVTDCGMGVTIYGTRGEGGSGANPIESMR